MSENKVINLCLHSQDNRHWTPDMAIENCLNDLRNGSLECNSVVIIPIMHSDGEWNQPLYSANISATQMLAAAAILTKQALNKLGY